MIAPLLLAALANGPHLALTSPARVGQPLTFQLAGSISPPGPADSLLLDTAVLPGGLPLGAVGTLYVGFGPTPIVVVGDGDQSWTVPVPNIPSLVGTNVFAQAVGLAPPGGLNDLKLSNLVVATLADGGSDFGRFALTADPFEGSVSAFHLNQATGDWRLVSYAHLGGDPRDVATHPNGRYAYAPRAFSNDVVTLHLEPASGALSVLGAAPVGGPALAALVEPTGRFLYVGTSGTGSVAQFSIHPATGALTPLVPASVPVGSRVTGLVATPNGEYVYALGGADDGAAVFRVEPSSGRLLPQGSATLTPSPTGLVFTPNGAFAYASGAGGTLVAFTAGLANGALAPLTSIALPQGSSPSSLAIAPSGANLYLCDGASGALFAYRLGGSGLPLPLSPPSLAVPGGALEVAVDPSGDYVYALSPADGSARSFAVQPGTGQLTALGVARTRGPAQGIAIARGPSPLAQSAPQLYVALEGAAEVRGFAVNPATGQLTALASAVADTAPGPVGLALHPHLPFGLSANLTGQSLTRLAVDANNGGVSALGSPTANAGAPFDVVFEPSGRFAYASLFGGSAVQPYAIHPNTWQLTPLSTGSSPAGAFPRGLCADPTGRFVYVAESFFASLRAFRIDGASGQLLSLGSVPAGDGAMDVKVSPGGTHAYAVSNLNSRLYAYRVDGNSGALVPLSPPFVTTGTGPFEIAIEPRGRFLYTANSTAATLSHFELDPLTGAPTLRSTVGTGPDPRNLAVDPSGSFLFVSSRAAAIVQVFAIDPQTGQLTPQSQVAAGGAQPRGLALRVVLD